MKKRITSYLDQLKFDKALEKMGVTGYLTNVRLVMLFVIGIITFGLFSFLTLPRRLNPEVQIPIVSVITAYPGAGPVEVERAVTEKIEDELANAKGLNTLSSTSNDSVSIITAEFDSNTSVDEARDEVQKLVSRVNDLPENALEPSVRELDFEDVPVWQFALTSDASRPTLEESARKIADEIESLSQIDRVEISGIETKEIQVVLDENKIVEYGLSPIQLLTTISNNAQSAPAGKIESTLNSYSLNLENTITSIDSIRNIPIQLPSGSIVNLGEIADIQYKSANNQKRSYISYDDRSNQNAVTLSVYKTRLADISDAQIKAAEVVNSEIDLLNNVIELVDIENVAENIEEQFAELFSNFSSTILLVFATLFIFLGLRQAAIASTSIPLTFLISFTVMNFTGQTLNFLTLFSLLLGLGLLVDDAIVIISAATTYYQTKKFTPRQTGLLVWRDYLVPIWTTTITTVWAFVPLLLATGIIGEFIKPIPIVVSTTLLASTTVAVLFTLPLMMILLKLNVPKRIKILFKSVIALLVLATLFSVTSTQPLQLLMILFVLILMGLLLRWRSELIKKHINPKNKKAITKVTDRLREVANTGLLSIKPVSNAYQSALKKVIHSSKLKLQVVVAVIIVSLFSYSLLPLGFVENEFFPKSDTDLIFITLELPTGTKLSETETTSLQLAETFHQIPEVTTTNIRVGQANRSDANSSDADNLTAINLKLLPEDERKKTSDTISNEIREILKEKNLNGTVYVESGGPPAGSDVTVKIIGEELSELQQIADQIESELQSKPGVINIQRSVKQGNSKLTFTPDTTKLAQYGLTNQDLALWMRTAVSGFELYEADFQELPEKTKVMLYLSESNVTPEEVSNIPILTQRGSIPITELGIIELVPAPSVITRENGNRTLTVSAGVSAGFNAGQINTEILAFADSLELEKGYSFATGGANEENIRSVQSILQAMLLSVLLILATMVVQLGSFRQAIIVILVIPLAVSGVFILFALTGTPLSFPALIGVLALFGIVVNNSIMVVDKINQNIKIGMLQKDAIIDATASRVEPILFSSLTTIIGLIPITLSDPLWRGLGGAIIAGLLFSGAIMLLVIPVVYDYFYPNNSAKVT